jgi:hypothetical protein
MATTEKYYKIKSGLEIPSQDTLQVTESTRPTIRPSLNLNFAQTKVLDPRITFARASTATYYSGKTEAKTNENLLIYSQEFDNAAWTKTNVTVTPNATTAPDGTTTADAIFETANTAIHRIYQGLTTRNGIHVASVYVKANGRNWFYINRNYEFAEHYCFFDLENGVVGTVDPIFTASIENVGDGWYRCTAIGQTGLVTYEANYGTAEADNTPSFLGDITKGVFLWGAQFEFRESVGPYTPTTDQPITLYQYQPLLQTASANVARFDHNPVTGESLGLLVEEQRTNLLLRSNDVSNAAWTAGSVTVTANDAIAPDGTLTAAKAVITNTASNVFYQYNLSSFAGQTLTVSFYGKADSPMTLHSHISDSIAGESFFPSLTTTWQRFTYTMTQAVTSPNTGFFISLNTNSTTPFYIWGVQLEVGAFATSLIPTEASQVTRSSDSASMTGTNFSDWYRQDEGTLYAEANTNNSNDVSVLAEIASLVSNRFTIQPRSSGNLFFMVSNGANQVLIQDTNCYDGKFAYAVKTNDVAGAYNANISGSDVEAYLPQNVHTLGIGYSITQSAFWVNGHIKKLSYYPARLTNAELQSLTSS